MAAAPTILIIDDDAVIADIFRQQLEALGYKAETAADGGSGDRLARAKHPDLILLDLRLPDLDGLTLLKNWRATNVTIPVVMVSGSATIPDAVGALKFGAEDFLVKPVDLDVLAAVVARTLNAHRLQAENRRLRELVRGDEQEFLGASRAVSDLLHTVTRIADSDHPVLIEGETGTGKQILARMIYNRSPRASEPFVRINCAAITTTLFESELFGHEKGAFTNAYASKAGKLELVGGGTLFLDEIGELPMETQAKLLTALEDRVFERVGGTKTMRFEGRIIAATNRNLEQEIDVGRFRRDLFYRLNTLRLRVPPLSERPDDVPVYINAALMACNRKLCRSFQPPDSGIMEKLQRYPWPGNVRELMHHVERIVLFAEGSHIPVSLWLSMSTTAETVNETPESMELESAVRSFKCNHINRVMNRCAGNQTQAAKQLGVSRSYLNRLLAEMCHDRNLMP